MSSSKHILDKDIIRESNSSLTMRQASINLGLHFNTFSRRAKKLNCYRPNQGGKNTKKPESGKYNLINLKEILRGKHPTYQTYKLRNRLIKELILKYECSECKLSTWNNKKISLELDHIDGVNHNHKLKNLRLLCPNCHSQTSTYRGKNSKNK